MKVCVIGLGSMGKRRIRLLKEFEKVSTIVGVESNHERAENVADACGIKVYAALQDIKETVDCAFVCTSPQSHASIIRECLESGFHVFSEINLLDESYDENIRLAQNTGKKLFLSSTPLYKGEMQFIGKQIEQCGKSCAYRYHVGQYLPDWHPWDKLNHFFVSSKATNGCRELLAIELPWIQTVFGKINKMSVIKKKLTTLELDFPDTYFIQLEHDNGNVGSLVVDVVSRQAVRLLEVFNEDLYIKWDGTPDTLYKKDFISGKLVPIQTDQYVHEQEYGDSINEYAYIKEIEEFWEVIDGKEILYGFEQDKEILKIIDEIER